MSGDAISNQQICLIEENLDPQSQHEFEILLSAFSALEALDFNTLIEPHELLRKLVKLVDDQLDSGYMQTLNSLILKCKEVLPCQVYYDIIFQDMTLMYEDKYYTYCDLLLRDFSCLDKGRDFVEYIQLYGVGYKTFVERSLLQYVNKLKYYNVLETANVFEEVLSTI
jgi:hypothetical protein